MINYYHYSQLNDVIKKMGGFIPVNIATIYHKDKPNTSILNHICTYDTETTTLFLYPSGEWDVYKYERDIHNYTYNEKNGTYTYKDITLKSNVDLIDYNELEVHTIVYLWTFSIYSEKWDLSFYGRTNEEFDIFIHKFLNQLEMQERKQVKMQIYVHNLSFDFTNSLQNIFVFNNVFSRKPHKPIYAIEESELLEFRDSYILTNSSLSNLTKNNVKYRKKSEFDNYLQIRLPDTDLKNDDVLEYAILDTLSLAESLHTELKEYKRVDKIPLTSTGKLRREVKKVLSGNSSVIRDKRCVPSYEIYMFLLEIFQGGDTHANVLYSDEVLDNVDSFDKKSAYPSVMIYEKFPNAPFLEEYTYNWEKYYNSENHCFLCEVTFYDIKTKCSIPYLKTYKCYNIKSPKYDNGRIWKAEQVTIKCTNIDLKIILEHYYIKSFIITKLYVTTCDYLTYKERYFILEQYAKKTSLKGIKSEQENYMRSKNYINAEFGRNVTRLIENHCIFNSESGEFEVSLPTKEEIIEELSKKKQKSQYTQYARGVFITAYARQELYYGIDIFDNPKNGDISKHIYNDTDSCKGFVDDSIIEEFNKLNDKIMNKAKSILPTDLYEMCKPKDIYGNEHFLGTWDYETKLQEEKYIKFKTYGSKKYCYKTNDSKTHITVSGLSKKCGDYIDFDEFKKGKLFTSDISGRTLAKYQTNQPILNINGKTYTDKFSLSIYPTTYKLGITSEYEDFINTTQHSIIVEKRNKNEELL